MSKIKIPTKDLTFREVQIKDLREDYVYSLIQHGKMTESQFAKWVEILRDTWFEQGLAARK